MKKINKYRAVLSRVVLLLLAAALAGSCKKDKVSSQIPRQDVSNLSPSSIRLFNFSGNAYITVNSVPLTSYLGNGSTVPGGTAIGLALFPTGVWATSDNASPFSIPNSLLDKDGNAYIQLTPSVVSNTSPYKKLDTTLANDPLHPKDYYLMVDGTLHTITRESVPPSNPQNFKIRVINLGSDLDPLNLGLTGPVTLTYADGTPVSSQLSNVAKDAISPYVEIPYGAYQFKVFIGGAAIDVTKQLSEYPIPPYYDACNPAVHAQEGLRPRLRTFKPGGVYSIVVSYSGQTLFTSCDRQSQTGAAANSYRILTELSPGTNNTYARMQAVNAIPGKQLNFTVDGKPLGGTTAYVGDINTPAAYRPEYQIYVQGSRHIQATDQNGNLVAEGDLTLYPYDNYTIWAYNKPDGKAGLLFESNDMTGTIYTSSYHPSGSGGAPIPDDGIDGDARVSQFNYALETQFLNLCPDLPYATFTSDHQLFLPAAPSVDTMRYFSAYVNLAPGVQPYRNADIIYSLFPLWPSSVMANGLVETSSLPNILRVYSSKPGNDPEIPGNILSDVAPVDVLQKFIANQALYTYPQLKVAETGTYTVAVVGKVSSSASAGEKARLIVIKHNN
jgi:hypothetical protein